MSIFSGWTELTESTSFAMTAFDSTNSVFEFLVKIIDQNLVDSAEENSNFKISIKIIRNPKIVTYDTAIVAYFLKSENYIWMRFPGSVQSNCKDVKVMEDFTGGLISFELFLDHMVTVDEVKADVSSNCPDFQTWKDMVSDAKYSKIYLEFLHAQDRKAFSIKYRTTAKGEK